MPKEKNYNPVAEHKKSEKQKQLKKQKATQLAQRNERLARRNPARIQRDIDALKQLSDSGEIRAHERQKLAELERDLVAVNKARAALGDKAPVFREYRRDDDGNRGREGGRGGRGGSGVLGKRGRDGNRKEEESSDTDADVADIPMPRDTPPPIPRRKQQQEDTEQDKIPKEPKKPTLVYEAAPQHRDLKKEAARFVPAAVAQKLKQVKGEGRLLEEEELEKLEKEGYIKTQEETEPEPQGKKVERVEVADDVDDFLKSQVGAEEAAGTTQGARTESVVEAAPRKPHQVVMEEVEDEDL
ncbi:hypothetical protein M011DRAFT_466324 [Sporormia fimetaria CBS 119925]|uniref:Wbp11/ELF5/Saf1 N-terminal domain-containing protein n=1 Tax=Sporormia fimetaria CBS 119925 TaxID=1340428 RepID=A0A6A6VHL1_9PLEO|nr:hypothetical protein M011DRAFT_466324 [Sporormia fimetaria CBS 119925]